jgi:hypothetical protein
MLNVTIGTAAPLILASFLIQPILIPRSVKIPLSYVTTLCVQLLHALMLLDLLVPLPQILYLTTQLAIPILAVSKLE